MEVIRDDMSEAGLRRLHVLATRMLELDEVLALATDAAIQVVSYASYEDDLGMWHFYLYWRRCEVQGAMVVSATYAGDHGEALRDAAGRYERRFGVLPNVAYMREGVGGERETVELRGKEGEVRGVVAVRRVGWMLPTDVGVTFEEAG